MKSKLQKRSIINNNSSIFIATFSHYEKGKRLPTNGMVEPMLSFFLSKVKKLVLLDEPHPVSDSINPVVEIFHQGHLKNRFHIPTLAFFFVYPFCKLPSKKQTRISYKIRDLLSVIYVFLTQKEKFDLFIGLEGINALAAILFRKLGKVKTVVYYVSDYSPTRYGKTFFNSLYLWLDKFCVEHADFTWDVSPAMKEGRIKAGILRSDTNRIIHVPNGLFQSQIDPLPISERARDRIIFIGIFDPELGIDLMVEALKLVQKERPKATLHIIGGTENDIANLKKKASRLEVEKSLVFYGFVPQDKEMTEIVRHCYIGVAPYRTYKSSRRRYGDSGKIRIYLGCGLPIVSTNLLWHTKYAIKRGAGIGVKDTPIDLAKGIVTLLQDENLYKKSSEIAIKLSKENTWENTYSKALQDMKRL